MNFKTILCWCMIASLFMDDFIIMRFMLPIDLYVYYVFFIINILYFIFTKRTLNLLPKWFFLSISLLIGVTVFVSLSAGIFNFKVIKQIIGIVFTSVAYYTYLSIEEFNIKEVFRKYLIAAFLVSAYGIFEELLHLQGIHISSNIRQSSFGLYRVYSIMGEPYFLAVVLIPAFYFLWSALYKQGIISEFKTRLIFVFTIGTCYILTFSSAGFIGLALIIIFWLYNKKFFSITNWKILMLPILIIVFASLFSSVKNSWKEFNIKTTQTFKAFTAKKFSKKDVSDLNSSSFALYSNYIVAKASFDAKPLTGSGLGTHEANYLKRFEQFFDKSFLTKYGAFNASDANSLFIRLMSETGLLGLGMFFLFLFKNFLRRKGYQDSELKELTFINQGIFIWFIVRLVRTGNYFGNGFFLFFFLYYFSAKIVKEKLKEKKKAIKQI